MTLDVVVPTYNRSGLLRLTVGSLLRAEVPASLSVTIVVVDNNSQDDTRAVVEEMAAGASLPVRYVFEGKAGSSRARNAGIAAGTGELIGFIDDDEEIEGEWYKVVAREFADAATEFIGGPYLANCAVTMPAWLPPGYNGVIGVIQAKPRAVFAPPFPGNLQSGNAVLRRSVFERVGMYSPKLGRTGKGLLSEEDAELYRRIVDAKLLGYFVPELAIYHHIPESRLTRRYYRSWSFWRGVSHGIADGDRKEPVAYVAGMPRYRVRQALGGLAVLPGNLLGSESGTAFARELALWDLMGFVRGKFFTRVGRLYGDG